MFRLWGKIFKENHLLRDTVAENNAADSRTHKIFSALEEMQNVSRTMDMKKSVMNLIWENPSGSNPMWRNSNAIKKPGFRRIILWKALNSIIWKFISLKKIKQQAVPLRGLTVCLSMNRRLCKLSLCLKKEKRKRSLE